MSQSLNDEDIRFAATQKDVALLDDGDSTSKERLQQSMADTMERKQQLAEKKKRLISEVKELDVQFRAEKDKLKKLLPAWELSQQS